MAELDYANRNERVGLAVNRFSLKFVFATLVLVIATSTLAVSQQQDEQKQSPCDSQDDSYAKTMKQAANDTSATEAEAEQIQKIGSLFKKNKQTSNNAQSPSEKTKTATAKPAQTASNQNS